VVLSERGTAARTSTSASSGILRGPLPERRNLHYMEKVKKSDAEWREELSDDEYYVTRKKGTERAFTGRYWDSKDEGMYRCVACGQPVFDSETKFDSGTGWPSFTEPAVAKNVETETDTSHGMVRTEVRCRRCGSHLGHVFDDGPAPTGLRYCINSAALQFEEARQDEPRRAIGSR
jgi:peptide-methionine (R)-S-oxide reductase